MHGAAEEIAPKVCLVCSTPVKATYYGIDACRACANFFKRAKMAGKTFTCRKGDRKCVIVRDEIICRGCRFDSCEAAGMVYQPRSAFEDGNELMKFEQDASTNWDEMRASTSKIQEEGILQRIGRLFNASVERRRIFELHVLQNRADRKYAPHPTQKIYMSSSASSGSLIEPTLSEIALFYEKAFPQIKNLIREEQDLLTKNYLPQFCIVDNAFRTRGVWGDMKRFIMCSVVSTIDLTQTDAWLGEDVGGQHRRTLISSIEAQNRALFEIVVPMLIRSQITIKELHAVLALILCEIDPTAEVSEETLLLLDKIRYEIFEDLQRYYKDEMGLSDFSTRLGHLVSLSHTIRECNSVNTAFVRLHQSLFDLYSETELPDKIKDMIL